MRLSKKALMLIMMLLASSQFDSLAHAEARFQVDWENLKLKFWGVSKPVTENGQFDIIATEKAALSDGIVFGKSAVYDLHKNFLLESGAGSEEANRLAEYSSSQVARTTYVQRSQYFKDGSVQVFLENHLSRAFMREDFEFQSEEPSPNNTSKYSGLIMRSDGPLQPMPFYKIMDEDGNVLFSFRGISSLGFSRNLMGRWFKNPTPYKIQRSVGKNPLAVQIRQVSPGILRVSRSEWESIVKDGGPILELAKIALVDEGRNL